MPEHDVFLSHNSTDKPAVEELARRLTKAGLQPWLDKWNLIPGEPWQEAIEGALDNAVRTRDEYRVIPVLLPGANQESLDKFLVRRMWVDFRSGLDDAEAFERLVDGVKGEAIVGGAYELPDKPAPYRGLLRFEVEHTRFFFGREADCERLVEKLGQHTFVALIGASGSGKSSLVRAGLLPALADDVLPGCRDWQTLVFTPGSHPLRALAEQLAILVPPADRIKLTDELTERFTSRTDGLRTAAITLLADHPRPLLLVVDQFEELFTLCQDGPERCRARAEQFIANLTDAVQKSNGCIRVLITLRADFLDRCLAFPELKVLLEDRQVLLSALSEPALREAVARPAQVVGCAGRKAHPF